jgi:hypothetical protein
MRVNARESLAARSDTACMKLFARFLFCAGVACATFAPQLALAADTDDDNAPPPISSQAPLDRYFGKLAMSPLGIVNAVRLVSWRGDSHLVESAQAVEGLAAVEDSVRDWETQFPADSWLPRVVLSLERAYHRFTSAEARAADDRVAVWLWTKYPNSAEAHGLLAERGMPDGATDAAYAARVDVMPAVLKP